jgi:catecholate siderophore receptor
MNLTNTKKLLLALLPALLATPFLHSQSTASTEEEAIEMAKFEVTDVPVEENIMPTSRPFNSVFGVGDSIMNTPRSVTIISREQLNAIAIQDVRDFAKLTSSSFTRSNFGAPANPDIRGQFADVFYNGMRGGLTSNGNGMPIDFNWVESVNIVKGPATAVQGTSAYVGGFIDYITKRPFFDQARGEAWVTLGTDGIFRAGVDYGAPVSDKLAYRISYSGEDSDGWYDDDYRKSHSLYAALTYRPSNDYEIFLNAQAFYAEYTENFGINRPTQNLIDNGLYLTGVNNNQGPGIADSDPQNSANVTSGFPANVMVWGPEVKIDRSNRLLKPGDNSIGRSFKVQAIQTFKGNPDLTIVNNNLFTFTRRETYSSYYYSEIVDPTVTLESRLEFIKMLGDHKINAGVAGRYISNKAYNDYFFEPAAVWDLTRDHNFIDVTNSVNFPGYGQGAFGFDGGDVPGYPGRVGSSQLINGDSNESSAISGSPFAQGFFKLNDQVSFVAGGRLDFLKVTTEDPFTADSERSISVTLPNVNASLIYSPVEDLSLYVTGNLSENTSGANGNGGGYAGLSQDSAGIISLSKSDFTQPSELFEVGAKRSLMDGKLFIGAAYYHQTRQNKPINSPVATFTYDGVEVELNYQPNKNFFTTFSMGYIDATTPGVGFEAINVSPPASAEVQRASAGETKIQGLPTLQMNGLLSYKFDNGFGLTLNGTYHNELNNNWAGTIVIPAQFEIDGSVYYSAKKWDVRLSLLNLTDEENWSPPNGTYGNESIVAEPGIRAELTIKYKF